MLILNLKAHQLYKVPSKCHPSSCQLSCRRTSGQNGVGTLRLADTCLCIIEFENFVGTTAATSTNSATSSGRATKAPISHAINRGSVYHQTVQTVLRSFNLKRLYSLIFIKAVLNNAKTHDAVLKRIKPRFTIKKDQNFQRSR